MSKYSVEAVLKAIGAKEFKDAFEDARDSVGGMQGATKKATGGIKSFMGGMGKVAGAIGITKLVASGFTAIRNSVGDAVSRVDTLNQFPKVLTQMGYGADEADASIARLSDGIQGLPTRLDDIAGSTQRMVTILGDVDLATESTLALNNAFLASGASSADAGRGLEQYTQMLSAGKVDMQSWRTLQETMPYALQETAESFGFAGESAQNDFYEALKGGDITMGEFNDRIIELSNETGGFAETALEASKGIQTSMQNIKTAIATGIANIITQFDEFLESKGFGGIAGVLDIIKEKVQEAFGAIVEWIPVALEWLTALYNSITESTAFQTLKEAIQQVIDTGKELITNFFQSEAWETIKGHLGDLIERIGEIDFNEVIKQIGEFIEKWSPLILGIMGAFAAFKVLNGIVTAVTTAVNIGGLAIGFLTSPIGLAAAAIGIIIGIGVLLYKNWDTIKAKATELAGGIKAKWNEVKASTSEAWNNVKTSVSNAWNNLKSSVTNGINSAKASVTNGWNRVKTATSNIWNGVVTAVTGAWTRVKSAVSNGIRNAYNTVTGFFGKFKTAGSNIIGNIASGITGGIGKITGAIGGVLKKARNLLPFSPPKDKSSPMVDIHKNGITEQIAKGIYAGQSEIDRAMKSVLSAPTIDINGSIARSNAQIGSRISHEISNDGGGRMEQLLAQIANNGQVIVLDSGELVGATYPQYDRVGGNQTQLTERWGR